MTQDPYKYFRVEAAELVGDLGQGLLELEKHADSAVVARLLRYAHTLKGAARIVKHRELADLAHAMEDMLGPLRDAPVTQRHDAALALVDRMTAQLATLGAPAPAVAAPAAAVAGAPLARIDNPAAEKIDDALGGLATIHALLARARGAADPRAAGTLLDAIDRELREVRRDVEHVRLAAAGTLFSPLERTARDAALASGRRVVFEARGGDVRVDAQVLAALYGALVQLVRNAVVHGIEPPARRTAAGKPAEGRVTVSIRSIGRRIVVTCEDDGGGLDLDAIRRAAQKRGAPAGQSAEPGSDAAALFALLLRGGISTSPRVTELSGRGIGLDVVRDAVQGLNGDVRAKTGATGTAITLTVPVSVAAVPVVNVAAGDRIAAIPLAAVRRVARVRAGDLVRAGGASVIAFDDVTVPCAPLVAVLGRRAAHGATAVLIEAGDGIAAVTIDRVLGTDDTVVRAVPATVPVEQLVWGVALDAEGHPYPVLEPHALAAAVRGARDDTAAVAPRRLRVLVVDDSLTTRMLEQSILESAGFDVTVAASAEEGLVRLGGAEPFDAVLVDVEMPGMDGFAMISELRARPALAELPAILVTSRDAPEDRRRGAAVGAQGYVVKSKFDQVELLAMIRGLVRG